MPQVTLKTIEQNDNVGMFSICFAGNSESEFEKFRVLQDRTYQSDFDRLVASIEENDE